MVKKAPESEKSEPIQLFVTGIPYEATEEQLREFFEAEKIGKDITEIKLPRFQDSGRCRGFAHVTFPSQEIADKALKMTRQSMGGRYLEVKPANGRVVAKEEDT